MSRYVDITTISPKTYESSDVELGVLAYDYDEVDAMPFLDIVRCKDCKHRYDDGWLEPRWTCDYLKDMRLKDDDFCSYGERKNDEGHN